MTLAEMTTTMRRDLSSIEEAQAAQKKAEDTYTYTTNRVQFLSDEAHEAAVRDHFPPVAAVRETSARAAEAALKNARRVLHQTEATRLVVTPDEQASAARQEPVIRRVVDTGTLPSIRDELRASIIADDRAALLVFASHLPDRLAKVSDSDAGRPEVGEVRSEITRMLSQIRDQLRDRSFDPVRTLATDVVGRAGDVSSATLRRQTEARLNEQVERGEKVRWPRAS